MDGLLRGLLAADTVQGGAVRVVAAVTTGACREAARRHDTTPLAGEALGRAISAGLLLATLTKGDERVTVQILGDGPLRGITVDANAAGEVRGFIGGARVAAPRAARGRGRVGPLVGRGVVNVIRDLGLRERYQGASALVSGEIDEDLEHHLTVSEQVESALACDVVVDEAGAVTAAGGVLVQCLPGGDVAAVARARARLRGGVHAALAAGAGDPLELATRALGAGVDALDVRAVRFRCPCSRERVTSALALCGEEELRSMIRDDGGAEATCNFCGERYTLDAAALGRLIGSLPRA